MQETSEEHQTMAGNASRTIMVTVKTAFQAPEAPRNVRFEGTTFGEMKERLSAVNLPGISGDSFVEVRLEGGGFLCLLDAEQLPEGDLVVNVHNYSKGLQWQKTMPFDSFAAQPIQLHFDTHKPHRKPHKHRHEHRDHRDEHPRHPHSHLGQPHHGPPHQHAPPPHEAPPAEGTPQQEHGLEHLHGSPHVGHGKGRKSDKMCGRHRRHHPSPHHSRSPSPHRHGRHCHRHGRHRHASRSRSPTESSSRSHSPPIRGGVAVHIHHHGPRFHGRGMHHHYGRMHRHMHGHGPHFCARDISMQEETGQEKAAELAPSQVEEPGVEGDWQEISETGIAARQLENLAV